MARLGRYFLPRSAPARHPTRHRPPGGVLFARRLRALSRLADRSGGRVRLRGPRLCADDEPRPPAGDAVDRRQPAAHDAIAGAALCALHQRGAQAHRHDVGGTLPRGPDRQRRLFPRLLPLHRTQSRARAHGKASARLSMVEFSRACGRREGRGCERPSALPRLGRAARRIANKPIASCSAPNSARSSSKPCAPPPTAAGRSATIASSARSQRGPDGAPTSFR